MSLRITREGWLWLLMAANLFLIGWGRGINLVVVLSYLLLLLWLVNALRAGRGLRSLQAVRRISAPLFAGTPFPLVVEVRNVAPHPLIGARLEDRGANHEAAWTMLSLDSGATVQRTEELTLPQRGLYRWGPLSAVSGHPFGLVLRGRILVPAEEVVVLPRLGRLHRGRLRRFLTLDVPREERFRAVARSSPAAQTEFHGLRPLRSGDSPRWIHWRTSARRGELMIREFEERLSDDLVLVVEMPPVGEEREATVSLAATVCWEWCRQHGSQLLLAVNATEPLVIRGTTGPELAHRLLERLALLDGTAGAPDALLDRLLSGPVPAGPVLVVGMGGELRDRLTACLRRPVAWIDAAHLDGCTFYERPVADVH